jgi:uncharacterized protein (DUF1778 family)
MPNEAPRERTPRATKDALLTFKVTPTDRATIERLASEAGLSLSAWIRQACLRAAGILP